LPSIAHPSSSTQLCNPSGSSAFLSSIELGDSRLSRLLTTLSPASERRQHSKVTRRD
jgi:hypothetical protein